MSARVSGLLDVSRLSYKPGWSFKLGGAGGSMLCVFAVTPDSNDPARTRCTQHQFLIPDDLPDHRGRMRWVFQCLLLCEQHEAGEFFRVDGSRPFMPHHQGLGDPYELVERWEP